METLGEANENDKKKAICRVCLNFNCEKSSEGMSLFEKYNNVYVYEKINYIASIEIQEDDNLPNRICSICLLALESACNFKQQCESSDAILHSPLQLGEALQEQLINNPVKEEEQTEYEYDCLEGNSPFPDQLDPEIKIECDNPLENKRIKTPFYEQQGLNTKIECSENKLIAVPFVKSKAIDLKLECHDCGGIFKSKCKLRVHWKNVHLPQQLICPLCQKTHKTYKSYHNHLKRKSKGCISAAKIRVEGVGKSRIFHCKECDTKSKRIQTIMTHLVIHTGERPHVCNICGKGFTQLSSLASHKEGAHNVHAKEGTCHLCGKYIKGRNKWYRHMRWHANVQLPCNVCNKVISSKTGLREHMKRHSDVKTLACELCAKTFYVASDLRNHKVKTHYKNKIYNCQECDYKTLNFSSMSKHRKRHTGNNIACDVCGMFVENEQQLMLHKKRHFERNFLCAFCDKTYYGRRNLLSHVRKMHNLYSVGPTTDKKVVKVEVNRDAQSTQSV